LATTLQFADEITALQFSCCPLAQFGQEDRTQAAAMTACKVMVGYAFILGAYFCPDNTTSLDYAAGDSLMRSV
jgi:hypothetical protein